MTSSIQIMPGVAGDGRITAFQHRHVVTCFAVISARYVVLIDTLVSPAAAATMVEASAAALGAGRQLLVINTHADWDHYWGNALFAGPSARYPAPILGHRLCRSRALAAEARAELAEMQRRDPQTFAGVALAAPTLTFDGALALDGGDLTFELIHTPGHQPDHIAVFIPETRTLFAGDAAELPLPFVSGAAALRDMRASLERMLALEPLTALYCHAPGVTSPDLIRANLAYLAEVERRASAALAAGRSPAAGDDLEALVAYPFAEVAHTSALDAESCAFYRDGHRSAIRATLEYLMGDGRL